MKDFNTLKGRHFRLKDGEISYTKKEYYWHIPKALREKNISKGDIVLVNAKDTKERVFVTDVLREDVEETGKKYKSVRDKIEPTPELMSALDAKRAEMLGE